MSAELSLKEKLENCIGDKEWLLNVGYNISHIIIASILVIYLKNKLFILTFLLFSMLFFISYTNSTTHTIQSYRLLIFGTLLYFIDIFIMSESTNTSENKSDENLSNYVKDHAKSISWKTMIWKIPYYGILSHYIIRYENYFSQ